MDLGAGRMNPLNTPAEVMVEQAERNLARDLDLFVEIGPHKGKACIVGGSPSLKDTLTKLRFLKDRGAVIVALNNTHDWLIERGIVPGLHVMLDARPENVEFVRKPHGDVTYLIAAQCHPEVFEALKGHKVITWVADVPGMRELADRTDKPVTLIGGGSTVGLKAMMLLHLWGFRSLHLFGMDSCYRDKEHHAYPQSLNDNEAVYETTIDGRKFFCAKWMVAQAEDFDTDARNLMQRGTAITAYGDGLLRFILNHLEIRCSLTPRPTHPSRRFCPEPTKTTRHSSWSSTSARSS
jgi:hypothetical protein